MNSTLLKLSGRSTQFCQALLRLKSKLQRGSRVMKMALAAENKAKPKKKKEPLTLRRILLDLFKLYVFYVLLSLIIIFGVKDKLVLFPSQDMSWKACLPILDKDLKCQTSKISIPTGNGNKLAGLYIKNPRSKFLTIVNHGNAGNIGHRIVIAANLIGAGSSVLLYDYQGYGESSGEAKLSNLVPDAEAAYDYAMNKLGYASSSIILYGESIGCGVTSGVMKDRTPHAFILQSPFVSLMKTAKDKLFFMRTLPDFIDPEPQLNNLAAVERKHPPLLLMHGDKDTTLPSKYSQELYQKASEPKQLFLVKGADHNDIYCRGDNSVFLTLKKFIESI